MRRESTIAEAFVLIGVVLGLTVIVSSVASRLEPLVWITTYQLLVVIAPVAIFALVRRDRFSFGFGSFALPDVLVALAAGVGIALVNIGIVIPLSPLTPGAQSPVADALSGPSLPLSLVVLALLPALGEELLFRGVLLRALAPRGRVIAVLVSAALFAGFHFSIAQLPPLFLVGIVTGVVALALGVLAAILIHAANNATAIVAFHLAPGGLEIGVGAALVGGCVLALSAAFLVLRARLR